MPRLSGCPWSICKVHGNLGSRFANTPACQISDDSFFALAKIAVIPAEAQTQAVIPAEAGISKGFDGNDKVPCQARDDGEKERKEK